MNDFVRVEAELVSTKEGLCSYLGIAPRTFDEWRRYANIQGKDGNFFFPEDKQNLAVFWVALKILGMRRDAYRLRIIPLSRIPSIIKGKDDRVDHLVGLRSYWHSEYKVDLLDQINLKIREEYKEAPPLLDVLSRLSEGQDPRISSLRDKTQVKTSDIRQVFNLLTDLEIGIEFDESLFPISVFDQPISDWLLKIKEFAETEKLSLGKANCQMYIEQLKRKVRKEKTNDNDN